MWKKPKTPRRREPDRSALPTHSRRRVLRTGLAAGATSLFLPAEWTRPVVQSILLPVHAQTSPASEPDSCEPVILEGCTADCSDVESETRILYTFGLDDQGCAFVEDVSVIAAQPGENQLLIGCVLTTVGAFEFVQAFVDLQGGGVGELRCTVDCAGGIGCAAEQSAVFSIDGNPHTVKAIFTADAGLVTLERVEVTPV